MKKIIDRRITETEGKFKVTCVCGSEVISIYKNTVVKALAKGTCKNCKQVKRAEKEAEKGIYLNNDKKWCSTCASCGIEQAYTRKEHARESYRLRRKCKSCSSREGAFSKNNSVGDKQRLYNKFSKSAVTRDIKWELTPETMFDSYTGKCALTGWDISITYKEQTASLDRIDSNKGYTKDNIQWVHSMVNMCKNKYPQEEFIKMCKDVADKTKW